MRRYVAEAFGTFVLVFAGTGAVVANEFSGGAVTLVGVAMAFALVVTAMIYTIGDLSGAHINPAVTLAALVMRRFSPADVLPYVVAQCVGAIGASATLRLLYPDAATLGATLPAGPVAQSFALEVLLTAILVFVVFNVTAERNPTGSLAGLVIGGVIGFEVFCGGPVSGASMNPARSLGPALVGGQLQHLWIYLVAPVLGAVLGALLVDYLRGERCAVPQPEPNTESLPT